MRYLLTLIACISTTEVFADYTGRYCELDGAQTSSGEGVSGECWMHSDRWGDLCGSGATFARGAG